MFNPFIQHALTNSNSKAVDRISHLQNEIRAAASAHIAFYNLGTGTSCEQKITALFKNSSFIYDRHWGLDDGKVHPHDCCARIVIDWIQEAWVIKKHSAYLNPTMVNTLKKGCFSSHRMIRNKHQAVFVLQSESPGEKEFLILLVALAATTVCILCIFFTSSR